MMFSMERRPDVSASNKSKPKEEQLKMGDIQKILGEQWNKMTKEERQPYQDMVTKDIERYKAQLAAFNELKKATDAAAASSSSSSTKA